jgi:cold-inducible RNA-binding protein
MAVRLFVGNLPYAASEAEIRQHFGVVGDPIQIVIPTDRETGRPRGFAFVDYDDRGMAERAIQQLHGQPFKGRPLSVSEARPREARPPMSGPPPPRSFGGAPSSAPDAGGGGFRGSRGDHNPNFGPNKPPKGRGGSNFGGKSRQQEGKAKGPLKERLSGRMFSIDEDSRFADEEDKRAAGLDAMTEVDEVKDVEAVKDDTEGGSGAPGAPGAPSDEGDE